MPPQTSKANLICRTRMQFNRPKDLQTPSGEESVKSVHGSPWHKRKRRKKVNFETRIEALRRGNVDYGRYPAVSLRRQYWTSTSFG